MCTTNFLFTKIRDLCDHDILVLIEELEDIRSARSTTFLSFPLLHFLTQCFLSMEHKKITIKKEELNGVGFLSMKISKLKESSIYSLCHEIAQKNRSCVEDHETKVLYHFLNTIIPNLGKQKPPRMVL
jgi:hypothetical protein